MNLSLVHIGNAAQAKDGTEPLVESYLERCASFAHCRTQAFRSEAAFLEWMEKQHARTPVIAVLFDSRGRQMSSEKFAQWIAAHRDQGAQNLVFAIGPADGWSETALKTARLTLSFGPMTLAHTLARLVAAEQIYRASTILSGHPYHTGH